MKNDAIVMRLIINTANVCFFYSPNYCRNMLIVNIQIHCHTVYCHTVYCHTVCDLRLLQTLNICLKGIIYLKMSGSLI